MPVHVTVGGVGKGNGVGVVPLNVVPLFLRTLLANQFGVGRVNRLVVRKFMPFGIHGRGGGAIILHKY